MYAPFQTFSGVYSGHVPKILKHLGFIYSLSKNLFEYLVKVKCY